MKDILLNHPYFFSQALYLLKLATAARRKALDWTNEAIDLIITVLSRTEAHRFLDVLISGFGFEEPGASEEDEPTASKSSDPTQQQKSSKKRPADSESSTSQELLSGKRRRTRSTAFVKEDLLHPLNSNEIKILAPPDEDSVLHFGVPEVLLDRVSTGDWKGFYECVYYDCASNLGLPTEEQACRYQASNKVGMSTHLRKCHLGCAFECPFCRKSTRFWDGSNWLKHLRSKHSAVPTAQWYTKKVTKADDE